MDYDRELEHVMMNVRGNMGSITPVVYAANMGKIKLIQFIARMAKKEYLSLKSRNDIEAFSRLSDGKYNIYNIPVSSDFCTDQKRLEGLQLELENTKDKAQIKSIKSQMKELEAKMSEASPIEQLKSQGIKNLCVLPKIDGEMNSIQVAVRNRDEQIFKSWFMGHLNRQMSGGEKNINDLKNFTEGNYSIFNLPFEGQELSDVCKDFDTLKINYAIMPDLKIGNNNSQIAIANSDREKFQVWIKMYREDMVQQGKEPGSVYEMDDNSYLNTAIVDTDEYIKKAEPVYQEANEEFEKQSNITISDSFIQKDNCEDFVRLDNDANYEKITINKETLVDNMKNDEFSRKMRNKGFFVSRIPGTYGDNEKKLVLPANNVFVADEGRTYVGFVPKNKPAVILDKNGSIQQAGYEKVHSIYDAVNRNMSQVKAMKMKTPSLSQNKNMNKPKL